MQQRPITLPHSCSTDDQQLARLEDEPSKDSSVKERPVPEAFKDLEPWLFQEFGDIVELVDE
jgi:ATP-dependent DNA helicase HFM1/MER3